MKLMKKGISANHDIKKKELSIPAGYKELLDILSEIIALDFLKNTEKDKGGKSNE